MPSLLATTAPALLLALAVAPGPARGGAPEGARPFAVALWLDEESPAGRFVHEAYPGRLPPEAVTIDLVGQARLAYATVASRAFRGVGGPDPLLRLEVRVVRAALDVRLGQARAAVGHQVVLRDARGAEVARLEASGEEVAMGADAAAATRAFAHAARSAAEDFLRRFEAAPRVAGWLAGQGLEPIPPPPPPAPPAGRPALAWHLDGGFGRARGFDAGLRGGLASSWGYAQLAVDRWSTSLVPGWQELTVWLPGLEAGLLRRLGDVVEIRAGAGVYGLQVAVAQSTITGAYYDVETRTHRRSSLVAGAGGAVSFSPTPGPGRTWRARIGLEGRRLFGARVTVPPLAEPVTAARGSLLLLVGVEFPVGGRAGAAGHAGPAGD